MQTRTLIRALHRPLLGTATLLALTALPAAAMIPALSVPVHAAPASAAMQQITIRASAGHFPKKVAAGLVAVTLIVDTKEEAEAGFARLNPGVTLAQVNAANAQAQQSLASFAKLSRLLTFIGGASGVAAGTSETVVLDMRTPGLYGMDLTLGQGPDHLHTFTVARDSGQGAAMPPNGIAVTLKDMKFLGFPKQVAAGSVSFRFTNQGPQLHEMSLVRLDPGKTQHDVLTLLRSPQGQNGPPPAWAHDIGGMDVLSPHQSAQMQLKLTPGYYIALCFLPDVKKHGTPHVMEGMITHFTVR
jgi:hypothetical protein